MKDLNSVVLVGRLTRDPELKYTPSGTAILGFDLAVNRSVKKGDSWTDEASFFNCTLFGKQAESVSKYMEKGKQVAISGELTQDRWEDKEGRKNSRVKIICNSLQLLGGKSEGKPDNTERMVRDTFETPENFESDIPF